jgi:hypothetical protein
MNKKRLTTILALFVFIAVAFYLMQLSGGESITSSSNDGDDFVAIIKSNRIADLDLFVKEIDQDLAHENRGVSFLDCEIRYSIVDRVEGITKRKTVVYLINYSFNGAKSKA